MNLQKNLDAIVIHELPFLRLFYKIISTYFVYMQFI